MQRNTPILKRVQITSNTAYSKTTKKEHTEYRTTAQY